MSDVLSKLENQAKRFSKGQRRIAEFILASYDKAAFMTASRLGSTVGVSESTVVRFAMDLGYDGYPQMQKALQELVLNNLTSVQRMGVTNDRMDKKDILAEVLHGDAEKVRKTGEYISPVAFQNSVQANNLLWDNSVHFLKRLHMHSLIQPQGYDLL